MSQQEQSTPASAQTPVTVYITTFETLEGGVKSAGPVRWEDLYARWRDREELPADTEKDGQPLISPAEFQGDRATNDAVTKVHVQVVEFDNNEKVRGPDGKQTTRPLPPERRCTFEQAVAFVRAKAWDAIVVTSYSHTPEHHKFRVYIRTSRPVTPAEHRRLQRWLHGLFDEAAMLPDPATIDPSRRWFIPIRRVGREYQVERVEGKPIDVDAVLSTIPSEPTPPRDKSKVETRLDEYRERLRDSIDMIDLLEDEGEKLERRGHYARLWRPFSDDGKSPGCVAYQDHFYDFGTCEYVDAISYAQKKKTLDFWAALDWLAERAGIPRFDRTKARRTARIDPQAAFDRLPVTLPVTGAEDVLGEVARAIATLDDADRPAWIGRVVDRFRHDVQLHAVDPQPLFDALPEAIDPKDAEGVIAPLIAAIATVSRTEQSDWIGRLTQKWKVGRRSVFDRDRLTHLTRDSHKAQLAALRASSPGELDREVLETLVAHHAKHLDRQAIDPDTAKAYKVIEGCLHLVRVGADGAEHVQKLLNGDFKIVRCVTRDDGIQTTDVFVIEATIAGGRKLEGIEVPTDAFDDCAWITPSTAGALRVEPTVRDARRYIAHAVLSRSTFERTRTFTSYGWHEIDGKQVFVHAGGAIGTSEPVDVRVAHPKLSAFKLSEVVPDAGEVANVGHDRAMRLRISACIERTLKLVGIAGPNVGVLLLASAVSAPVMQVLPVRVPVLILGTTGSKKSSVAREYQRMFGRFVTDQDFVLNFESTTTATSFLGFVPQHMLAVADDAYPKGDSREAEKQRSHVRSLVHNYVNGQTRERGTRDGGLATSRPIRALLWLTAETDLVPPQIAESTAYRTLKIRLKPGDVNEAVLTEIQSVPDMTIAMRAYIEHLVAEPSWRGTISARFALLVAQLRAERANLGLQDRQPEIIASLVVAFENWLRWAASYMVNFDDEKVSRLVRIARKAIVAIAVEQTAASAATNPANSFVETLRALLVSGRCRVVERHQQLKGAGTPPEIGWYDEDQVIFEPASAYQEARRIVDHDLLPWPDLYDRLVQARLCEPPTQDEKSKVTRGGTRTRAGGARGYFLVFKREVFEDVPFGDSNADTQRELLEQQARLSEEADAICRDAFGGFSKGGDA